MLQPPKPLQTHNLACHSVNFCSSAQLEPGWGHIPSLFTTRRRVTHPPCSTYSSGCSPENTRPVSSRTKESVMNRIKSWLLLVLLSLLLTTLLTSGALLVSAQE